MAMPKDQAQEEFVDAWRTYIDHLEKSLDHLEEKIGEAEEMTGICTDEWCEATEHVIDDLGNALFTIHEPRWASEADTKRIKKLKKRVYDLYANYRQVYQKANA